MFFIKVISWECVFDDMESFSIAIDAKKNKSTFYRSYQNSLNFPFF